MAQLHRVSCSETGGAILRSLRIPFESQHRIKCSRDDSTRSYIHDSPIPQNLHPVHHEDRRTGRASALNRHLCGRPHVLYVDAPDYHN
ncbi:hypothetical protein HPB48_006105 [Haemaphysalis longicornis]|uniref:Uncharacterized protein n=1 Tax=Haemaphysalis longicornis TaxID=44386 RepID=A0A9J6GWG4_HAELO|nr:hypothetical protein HPB48_006105 [Haemaphysalis longicornis]